MRDNLKGKEEERGEQESIGGGGKSVESDRQSGEGSKEI